MESKLKLQHSIKPATQQPMLPTFSGKRTSSSSGVSSSAKSEKSDSSFSLDDKSNRTKPNGKLPTKNISSTTSLSSQTKLVKKETTSSTKSISIKPVAASKLTEPKIKLTKTTQLKPESKIAPPPSQGNLTGIPKPTAAVKGTSKIIKEEKVSPPLKEISQNETQTLTSTETIAVVSPIQNPTSEVPSSQLSESSNSASTGQHSNSSESSVIYRPSSESGSEQPPPQLKPSIIVSQSSHGRDNSLGDEDPASLTMSVKPMPLVRGYCNNLTMPTVRQTPRQQYLMQRKLHTTLPNTIEAALGGHGPGGMGDYCNIEEIVNGYMSDGELIRNGNDGTGRNVNRHGVGIGNHGMGYDGYTSEQDYRAVGQNGLGKLGMPRNQLGIDG